MNKSVILLIVLILIMVVLALEVVRGPMFSSAAKAANAPKPEKLVMVALEERTVNLSDASSSHYLKLTICLAVAGGKNTEAKIKEVHPRFFDDIIMVTTRYDFNLLLNPKGKERLKAELLAAFNRSLTGSDMTVRQVLFTDFVME